MIVAYSYVSANEPEVRAEFEAAMRDRARAVEGFPGFVRFEFRKEAGRRGRYVIVTWWESRSDLSRWLRSSEHEMTHSKLSERARASIGAPRVELHEVLEVSVG